MSTDKGEEEEEEEALTVNCESVCPLHPPWQTNSQSPRVARDIVAEDDASHARLSRPRLAHQQHLLLLGLLNLQARLGRGRGVGGLAICLGRHAGQATVLFSLRRLDYAELF